VTLGLGLGLKANIFSLAFGLKAQVLRLSLGLAAGGLECLALALALHLVALLTPVCTTKKTELSF